MPKDEPKSALPYILLAVLALCAAALIASLWPSTPSSSVKEGGVGTEQPAEVTSEGSAKAPRVLREANTPAPVEAPDAGKALALPGRLPKLALAPVEPDYGRLETAGQLPKEAGAQAISALYPQAMMCLVEARKKDPSVGARITLRLLVVPDPSGRSRIADLDPIDKGKTSKPLRDCLRQAAAEIALQLGPEVRGTVTAPMVLGKDPDEPPPGAMLPMQRAGEPQQDEGEDSDEPPDPKFNEHGVEIDGPEPEPHGGPPIETPAEGPGEDQPPATEPEP